MKVYLRQRDVLIFHEEKFALIRKTESVSFSARSSAILKLLTYRPLMENEAKLLPVALREKLLFPFVISVKSRMPPGFRGDFFPTEEKPTAWALVCKKTIRVFWKTDSFDLSPGEYLLPLYPVSRIEGDYKINGLRDVNTTEVRDEWIIHKLRTTEPKSVFELGMGDQRLRRKISSCFPDIKYKGMDLISSSQGTRGDFLKSLPVLDKGTVAIAEEVIEHVPEKAIVPLFRRLRSAGVSMILLTTPNKSFTKKMGRKKRHPDHCFEWDYQSLRKFLRKLKSVMEVEGEFQLIGKKLKGTRPTWGLVIKFK